ncbi:MAG: hypothetical protein AAFR35_11270 [Pseudomonadota bacterium]
MVENYTNAFLVSAFTLVYMTLFAIWAFWGLIPVLILSAVANRLIPRRED